MKTALPLLLFLLLFVHSCNMETSQYEVPKDGEQISLNFDELKDKIRGGWAGQVIGCTYGGPTEFKFNGSMIPDEQYIPWYDGIFSWWYENAPGLYDDIYMDLTFVDVFEKEGLDAPIESFANAFASADYWLWHANQAARYNILNGIQPPESGHWKYNPHADDIDFQIEADFAGIMAPGMVNSATEISDGIGHIMNYGDGWYGGVYVAAMYALAYISDDVEFIVREGLKAIPQESSFYRLQSDVINWYEQYPDDWKMNWFQVQKKWAFEVGCPDGVYSSFNIDAKINAAYIIMGLLYGQGDFGKTVEISTLCGQDSDCNPASSAGILGVMLGYSNIPSKWKVGLDDVEDQDFKYTDISLMDAYDYSFSQALEVIKRNNGEVGDSNLTIVYQEPEAVRYEKSFNGHFPAEFRDVNHRLSAEDPEFQFEFEGNGFVVTGGNAWGTDPNYTGEVDVYIDGELHESANLPGDYRTRRHEISWGYDLGMGTHQVKLVWKNPKPGIELSANRLIIYTPGKEIRQSPTIKIL